MKPSKFEWTIIAGFIPCFIIVLLFSCDKTKKVNPYSEKDETQKYLTAKSELSADNVRGRTTGFWHNCAQAFNLPESDSVRGVASSVNVIKLRLGNAYMRSYWISFFWPYVDEYGVSRNGFIQWGYAVHKDWGLIPAFQIWGATPASITYYDNPPPLKYGTECRFEFVNKPGTTIWTFSRYGQPVLDVDIGITSISRKIYNSCTESQNSDSYPDILHIRYLDYYNGTEWKHTPAAQAGNGFPWDIHGKNQDPSLEISEYYTGGKVRFSENILWQQ